MVNIMDKASFERNTVLGQRRLAQESLVMASYGKGDTFRLVKPVKLTKMASHIMTVVSFSKSRGSGLGC